MSKMTSGSGGWGRGGGSCFAECIQGRSFLRCHSSHELSEEGREPCEIHGKSCQTEEISRTENLRSECVLGA